MPLELYYTSARAGLRPGDSGFCTVAASEGIGRTLYDRLEVMSGFRHLPDGATTPVAQAHWILDLEGRHYHVLSRVCDAGLDYTQRTNSFAHHLVLDPSEMSGGGPAYLLQQPGLMQRQWDGHVGIIAPRALPPGNVDPTPNATWLRLTGDAGWAGAVAQLIATQPWKTIGLLYQPGQEVFPLIAEAVAMLPPAMRWQATFNTYFTSLPGAVGCQWRCCPVGTPAAAAVARAAADGLLIDLTRPQLPAPPDNPWTQAARAGHAGPATTKAAARQPIKPIPFALKPIAAEPAEQSSAPQPEPVEQPELVQQNLSRDQPVIIPRGGVRVSPATGPARSQTTWAADRQKLRRKKLVVVYGIACCVIGIGTCMAVWIHRRSSEVALPPPPASTASTVMSRAVSIVPALKLPPPPQRATQPVEAIAIAPPATVTVIPAPTVPALVPTTVSLPAPSIIMEHSLTPPAPGKGLRDPVVEIPLAATKFDHPEAIARLSMTFPDGSTHWTCTHPDLHGTFEVEAIKNSAPRAVTISWHESADARPMPVLTITLLNDLSEMDFTWSNALMLRQPHVAQLAYWLVQNSQLIVSDAADRRSQKITFPLTRIDFSLADMQSVVKFPENLPVPMELSLGRTQPEGWKAATLAPTAKMGEFLIRLEKPPGLDDIVPSVLLRYNTDDHRLSNDLAGATEIANSQLTATEVEQKRAASDADQVRKAFEGATADYQKSIKEWSDRPPAAGVARPGVAQPGEAAPDEYQRELRRREQILRTHLDNEAASLTEPLARQKKAEIRIAALREALAAYADLKEIDIVAELPQGLCVAIVRLKRGGP